MHEAVASEAVGKGWVPAWLPARATQIQEIHNLDTNAWAVSFKYPKTLRLQVPGDCTQVKGLEMRGPQISAAWWPSDVPPGIFGTHRHAYFECAGYAIAKSDSSGEGYVWSIGVGG
jgi:hypothetical protein